MFWTRSFKCNLCLITTLFDSNELIVLAFKDETFSKIFGSVSLYRVLVSAAVAVSYSEGPSTRCLALHRTSRAALFLELGKLIYLLRAHDNFPTGDEALKEADADFELQVTSMHVLLSVHDINGESGEAAEQNLCAISTTNEHVFACRLTCVQLLMVAASSSPEKFEQALMKLATERVFIVGAPTKLLTYTLRLPISVENTVNETRTARVPALLVPFLRSLLTLLELQLLEVGCTLKGGIRSMVSSASGAKVIPILVRNIALLVVMALRS